MRQEAIATAKRQMVTARGSTVYLQAPDPIRPDLVYRDYAGLVPGIMDAVREAGPGDCPMHVALRGGSGFGKTTLAHAVALALDTPCYTTQGAPDCSAQDLIVFPVATSPRRFDAIGSGLFSAFVMGGIALFDEIGKVARHAPEALTPLASMLDDRRRVFSDYLKESFAADPGFTVICTLQNDESLPEYLTKRMLTFTVPAPGPEDMLEIVKANVPAAQPALVDAFRLHALSAACPTPRDGGNILHFAHRMARTRHGDAPLSAGQARDLILVAMEAVTQRRPSP